MQSGNRIMPACTLHDGNDTRGKAGKYPPRAIPGEVGEIAGRGWRQKKAAVKAAKTWVQQFPEPGCIEPGRWNLL